MSKKKKDANKDTAGADGEFQQTDKLAELFKGAPTESLYSIEKNMINNCLIRLDDFKGDFRYINEDIEERVAESSTNLQNLPELMFQIFYNAQQTMSEHKTSFLNELDEVIFK